MVIFYSRSCPICLERFVMIAKNLEEKVYLRALVDADWANHMMEHVGVKHEQG